MGTYLRIDLLIRNQSFEDTVEMMNWYALFREQVIGKKQHRELCALCLQAKHVQLQTKDSKEEGSSDNTEFRCERFSVAKGPAQKWEGFKGLASVVPWALIIVQDSDVEMISRWTTVA